MRRLAALAVLLALLVVADRGAAAYAGRTLAAQLQRSAGLADRPEVRVTGVPFLLQVVRGRYARVEVVARDVPAGDTTLARLDVVLTGAHLPLSQVLSGEVARVPVEGVQAQVRLSYDELARRSGSRQLTVEPAGDRVRVRGEVQVLGRRLGASAVSTVTLEGDDVVVSARSFEVGNAVADALLTRALRDRLDLRVAVRDLPYGLIVRAVRVARDGVVVRATATGAVLSPR